MKPHEEAAIISTVGEKEVGRRFRAFYLAAFAVAGTGLIGSWFVPNARVSAPVDSTVVTVNANDTGEYISHSPDLIFDSPTTPLGIPNFLLKPAAETQFLFGEASDGGSVVDTDYTTLFGVGSLP